MTKRNISITLFLLFSLGHLIIGFMYPRMPGWKMFSRAAPAFDYRIQDAEGKTYRIKDVAPAATFAPITKSSLLNAVTWLDNKYPDKAPHVAYLLELPEPEPEPETGQEPDNAPENSK